MIGDNELLKYVIQNGMIDPVQVQLEIEKLQRKEFLKKHKNAIWQGADGRWITYLDCGKGRRMIRKRTLEEIEDEIISYWQNKMSNPTIKEAFDEYNDGRLELNQISAASHMRYKQDFVRYYGLIQDRRVRSITAEELCDYIEKRISELELTSRAFANFKTITKGMFKRAYRRKYVDFRIEEEVLQVIDLSDRQFKKVRKEDYQEVFTEEEYRKYINYLCENLDRWNAALLLILITGMRGGEVVTLSYEDLHFENDVFSVNVNHTETRYKDENGRYAYGVKEAPKTDAGIRRVIVPKQFNWLYDWFTHCKKEGYIFIGIHDTRITTNSLRRRQVVNCKRLGFYQKSPHKGRKTYGSILLDNNLDNNMIMQQMGHTDISTTERFYHRNIKNQEKKAELISNISSFEGFELLQNVTHA